MRTELPSFHIEIAGAATRSSTTIASVGGYVLVLATTIPDHAAGLTSCYLSTIDGAIAASHLRLGPAGHEQLSAQVLPRAPHVAQHARACLLDHAAELQHAIADLTRERVLVDITAGALERAIEAWGPAAPDS